MHVVLKLNLSENEPFFSKFLDLINFKNKTFVSMILRGASISRLSLRYYIDGHPPKSPEF